MVGQVERGFLVHVYVPAAAALFRRVKAAQAVTLPVNVDCVAVNDGRHAHMLGRYRRRGLLLGSHLAAGGKQA